MIVRREARLVKNAYFCYQGRVHFNLIWEVGLKLIRVFLDRLFTKFESICVPAR